ncbi:sister chromatid cohesion protein SCC4 isoform X1 [Nymphaea colorata]|nr:sister chromatid cohesion protein SCC4 isoform X1 [Nymphaea colorata]
MEAVAEALWGLADIHESSGDIGAAVKCLEAICQSQVSFLPMIEVKTRLRIATILLNHTDHVNHAKAHLERSQLLLKQIPSCFELKCRAYSLLSQCYHLVGAIPPQKQILNKGLELTATQNGISGILWSCNFNLQLANALVIDGDYHGSIRTLECGYLCASQANYSELMMVFATSMLHVHLMQWEDMNDVKNAVEKCDEVWRSIPEGKRQYCRGLYLYSQLLHTFYLLRICDYKNAAQHVEKMDATLKEDMQHVQQVEGLIAELNGINESLSHHDLHHQQRALLCQRQIQLQEHLKTFTKTCSAGRGYLEPSCVGDLKNAWKEKLELGPAPLNGEWLPKSAVHALVDLVAVIFGRPKGLFKECTRRLQSGLNTTYEELLKLGITDVVREVDLQHRTIWIAGVYLMLLMQLLENKVAIDLTRSEFFDAQEALWQMKNWFLRFPTILQGCESMIEMLIGQYAHSVGCYKDAAWHFIEAAKLTENKSFQAMCQIYAAVSFICIGDAESSSQALDLIGPIYRVMDSFIGVREKTGVLFAYGLLQMRQHNLQEARIRLASGLRLTHQHLGNIQLVSQYLTVLGSLALALHDTGQAREILKSSLTLAKTLYDVPTQIWILSIFTALYQELGESRSEVENADYERKKIDDLRKRISDAESSPHHLELIGMQIEKLKTEAQLREFDMRQADPGPSMISSLDIPESVDLVSPLPSRAASRLTAADHRRRRT